MSTKNTFFKVFCLLVITFWRYIYNSFQRLKVKKKSQNSRNQGVFLHFLLVDGKIRIRTNNDGCGSRRPKNIRILRIRTHNIAFFICLLTKKNHMKWRELLPWWAHPWRRRWWAAWWSGSPGPRSGGSSQSGCSRRRSWTSGPGGSPAGSSGCTAQ